MKNTAIRAAFKEDNFFVRTGWAGTKEDGADVKEAGDGVTLRYVPLAKPTERIEKGWLGQPAEHQVILAKAY